MSCHNIESDTIQTHKCHESVTLYPHNKRVVLEVVVRALIIMIQYLPLYFMISLTYYFVIHNVREVILILASLKLYLNKLTIY